MPSEQEGESGEEDGGESFEHDGSVGARSFRPSLAIFFLLSYRRFDFHLRAGRRTSRRHVHTCPIGLRCSCVPIHFGGHLLGVAKLVVDAGTSDAAFKTSLSALNLIVSEACKDAAVNVLSEQVSLLRQRVTELQGMQATDRLHARDRKALHASRDTGAADDAGAALVSRALAHLQRHYQDPTLSLQSVAETLGCNPKYLTSRFSCVVGERMHTYLVTLRVFHACRLLVRTNQHVNTTAAPSGFPCSDLDSAVNRRRFAFASSAGSAAVVDHEGAITVRDRSHADALATRTLTGDELARIAVEPVR